MTLKQKINNPKPADSYMDLDKLDKIFWIAFIGAIIIIYLWLRSIFG